MSDIVVVTGGAGFIGSNILAGLEAQGGRRLVCCDLFGDGAKWRNVAKRQLHDVVPPARLLDWLDSAEATEVRAIVHMGAISDTTARDVDNVLAQNFTFTRALWRWASRRQASFIYASSAATYGDGRQGFDDDPGIEALARLRPLNPYGWSKHLFDRFAAAEIAAGRTHPAQHVGLKFFNVYGPNEYHKAGQRSVVHQIHPVAARAVYAANGVDAAIVFRDMPADLRDHYQYFTEARLDRLRAAGYAHGFLPLEEGVRRYVQDFLRAADGHA